MSFFQILLLALIQGLCELLPVSSSAHVIVAEKLMGLDPSSPQMTLLLVMLHTGTMFAVIVYFWKGWKQNYFSSKKTSWLFAQQLLIATLCTGFLGLVLKVIIEKYFLRHLPHAEVEHLFSNLPLIATSLGIVGLLMIYAEARGKKSPQVLEITTSSSCWIGLVQGFCLPFRGFSRSGSTISTGLLLGLPKQKLEEFSFALAVVLTPPIILKELARLLHQHAVTAGEPLLPLLLQSCAGMVFSFIAGLVALKWLSQWLEKGCWRFFGFYCLLAAGVIFMMSKMLFL
ncbi:MAG: undecaprenyl-diphosphate phosphatase [Chthoniobacterales bacterium]|nr:undecaprenyl-diphosphate phosphatase [Chthoniobacterales bacterium]